MDPQSSQDFWVRGRPPPLKSPPTMSTSATSLTSPSKDRAIPFRFAVVLLKCTDAGVLMHFPCLGVRLNVDFTSSLLPPKVSPFDVLRIPMSVFSPWMCFGGTEELFRGDCRSPQCVTPILEAVSHEATHYAVSDFPSLRPCVPTVKDKRARSDNFSLTSSDTMSSKSLMSFISLYGGRNRLPALAVTPRCTTRASVSTLRGGRKSEKPSGSRPGGSGMITRRSPC